MRSVLVKLGPWDYTALPVIFIVLYGIMLAWQWADWRYGEGKKLDGTRFAITAIPAALLSLLAMWAVNKVAPVEIKAWGTMLVVAFTAGTLYIARYGDRKVIAPAETVDMALYALIGAVIGSRVIFVALDWGTYAGHPLKLFNVWEGGLSFHGGLLGALLAGLLFAHRRHKNFWALTDEAAPGIALGYSFARVGCFLNGCCHGHACNLPWAMRFPNGELPNQLVHPTQLYAIVMSMTIFFILIKLRGKFPRPGHLFATYLALYSVGRFLLEFTRSGATGKLLNWAPWMTVGQFASILIFLVAVLAIALTWKSPEAERTEAARPKDGHPRGRRH
ncbi:MAG: prolipoprotein diacylglyceryl transferase [Bacteroidota bacterium]